MTELSLSELRDAEKVPGHGGNNSYLVRVGEGEYKSVPNTGFTTLALHDDDVLEAGGITVGSIDVTVDFDNDEFVMERDGDTVRVPDEVRESFLYAVHDRDETRLNDIFDEHWTPTVRQGVMDWFMPRFRQDGDISKTDEGWLLDGEVLVRWDASNEVADPSLDTHVVRGGSTKQMDVGREAIDVSMPAGWMDELPVEASTPSGREVELDATETRFLITVSCWFDRNPDIYMDELWVLCDDASVDAFTDPKSGIRHGHSRWNKSDHHVTDLGVTEEAAEMLWSSPNDHGGPHELIIRRQEFENAPIDVFEDAPNDDVGRWNAIESAKNAAPIPQEFKKKLEEMFSSDD